MTQNTPPTYMWRITASEAAFDHIEALARRHGEAWLLCHEVSSQGTSHFHLYVEHKTEASNPRAGLRNAITSVYGKGNANYSSKICGYRDIDALAYHVKDGNYRYDGLPEDVVRQAEALDQTKKQEIAEKKKDKLNKVQQLLEELEWETLMHDGAANAHAVTEAVIEWHLARERPMMLSQSVLVNLVQTLCCIVCPYFRRQYSLQTAQRVIGGPPR